MTEKLLPIWFENGVNTMFPIEVGVWGDQFAPAREKYGKGMLGVGGMDKTALRRDKAAVDKEIERMKRLAELGGRDAARVLSARQRRLDLGYGMNRR